MTKTIQDSCSHRLVHLPHNFSTNEEDIHGITPLLVVKRCENTLKGKIIPPPLLMEVKRETKYDIEEILNSWIYNRRHE